MNKEFIELLITGDNWNEVLALPCVDAITKLGGKGITVILSSPCLSEECKYENHWGNGAPVCAYVGDILYQQSNYFWNIRRKKLNI